MDDAEGQRIATKRKQQEQERSSVVNNNNNNNKRSKQQQQSSSSNKNNNKSSKKQKQFIDIPCTDHYHVSWMHNSIITTITASSKHGYVITGDSNGIVKFWKRLPIKKETSSTNKQKQQIEQEQQYPCLEFVKSFTAHSNAVKCLLVNDLDEDICVSISDTIIKFYHVPTFDATNMIYSNTINKSNNNNNTNNNDSKNNKLLFGSEACWIQRNGTNYLVITYINNSMVSIISPDDEQTIIENITFHVVAPVTCIEYIQTYKCIISTDISGKIEIWDINNITKELPNGVTYQSRNDTDLYYCLKKKIYIINIAISNNTNASCYYAMYCSNHTILIMDHKTGKIIIKFDESIQAYNKLYASKLDTNIEYGKRISIEREIQQESNIFNCDNTNTSNSIRQKYRMQFFSNNNQYYLIVPCIMGIKIIDIKNKKIIYTIGKKDISLRYISCYLITGNANVNTQLLLARNITTTTMSSADQEQEQQNNDSTSKITDTLLIALAYNQRRLYVYSHIDPVKDDNSNISSIQDDDVLIKRDAWNEPPDSSDQLLLQNNKTSNNNKNDTTNTDIIKKVILHTTMGDIHIQLFYDKVPKTYENFIGHCQSGYYDNVIFHRVIKGFMIQTGDPLGDGTGGESIWGNEFDDEIVPGLRHDRPFTVSMANAGPNTNGSQFFITTTPTPHLDTKHTVFGRVVRGMDICTAIENVQTDKFDKPINDIRIHSVDLE